MKEAPISAGWIGGAFPVPPNAGLADQPTRIAEVDPITGAVASTGAPPDPRSEATLAVPLADAQRTASPRRCPEFAPLLGRRGPDLETRLWAGAHRRPAGLRRARWALALLAFAGIGGAAIFYGADIGARGRASSGRAEAPAAVAFQPQRPEPPADPVSEPALRSPDAPSLAQAVSALIEGRLDEALSAYRSLAARYPENPAVRLTVEILTASKKEGAP